MAHLDHQGLATVSRVCKSWHEAATADALWQALCDRQSWAVDASHGEAEAGASPARHTFRSKYSSSCYDCLQPCDHCTLGFATLVLRLCSACAGAYADPNPSQRLVTKTHAQYLYRMRPADLAALPHAVASNPINPAFLPMHLYRKADVEEAAWEKKRTSTKSVRRCG